MRDKFKARIAPFWGAVRIYPAPLICIALAAVIGLAIMACPVDPGKDGSNNSALFNKMFENNPPSKMLVGTAFEKTVNSGKSRALLPYTVEEVPAGGRSGEYDNAMRMIDMADQTYENISSRLEMYKEIFEQTNQDSGTSSGGSSASGGVGGGPGFAVPTTTYDYEKTETDTVASTKVTAKHDEHVSYIVQLKAEQKGEVTIVTGYQKDFAPPQELITRYPHLYSGENGENYDPMESELMFTYSGNVYEICRQAVSTSGSGRADYSYTRIDRTGADVSMISVWIADGHGGPDNKNLQRMTLNARDGLSISSLENIGESYWDNGVGPAQLQETIQRFVEIYESAAKKYLISTDQQQGENYDYGVTVQIPLTAFSGWKQCLRDSDSSAAVSFVLVGNDDKQYPFPEIVESSPNIWDTINPYRISEKYLSTAAPGSQEDDFVMMPVIRMNAVDYAQYGVPNPLAYKDAGRYASLRQTLVENAESFADETGHLTREFVKDVLDNFVF